MIKPVNIQELNATIKMVLNKHRQYQDIYSGGQPDSVLRIVNGVYLQEQITIEEARAKRTKRNIGVVILAIDQLSLIRKHYGYEGEKYVLKQVSNHLNKTLRQTDLVYCTEDSQILILLPDCALKNAQNIAEQIRADSHDLVANYDSRKIWMSFSLGVTCFGADSQLSLNHVIQSANSSLAKAQQEGGNRVITAEV
jgi:diguanylate cyclase (GGDEF)-like protein